MKKQVSMTRALRYVLAMAVMSWATAGFAQKKLESSILWEVSSPGSATKSYILGTFYPVYQNFIIEHPAIQAKVDGAERIYTDTKMDSSMLGDLARQGMAKDSQLMTLMTVKERDKLNKMFEKPDKNLDYLMIYMFKPAMAEELLMNNLWLETEYGKKYGAKFPVVLYLQQQARKNGQDCRSLEGMEWQFHSLLQDPVSVQFKSLQEVIEDPKKIMKRQNAIAKAYDENDAAKLEKLLISDMYKYRLPEAMLLAKNEKWSGILAMSFKEKGTFAAVNAAHLYGKGGLVELLRKQGFTVTPIGIE